jgi:hypothetical protein
MYPFIEIIIYTPSNLFDKKHIPFYERVHYMYYFRVDYTR